MVKRRHQTPAYLPSSGTPLGGEEPATAVRTIVQHEVAQNPPSIDAAPTTARNQLGVLGRLDVRFTHVIKDMAILFKV